MCGFLAQFELGKTPGKGFPEFSSSAESLISRRGPDSLVRYKGKGCYISFARLCINAPTEGYQPFLTENETLGFGNGEIYNIKQLKSRIDVSKTYAEELGEADVRIACEYLSVRPESDWIDLDGMFALVLQRKDGTVIFGRDRTGQKPAFYYRSGTVLIVSSNFEALALQIGENLHLDLVQLQEWIKYGGVASGHSLFQEIKEIKPGTVSVFTATESRSLQYWKWPQRTNSAKHSEEVITAGRTSLELLKGNGVPECVFWSGGIDSTVILRNYSDKSHPMHSVHISFQSNSFDEPINLLTPSNMFHHEVFFEKLLTKETIHKSIELMDMPISDPACLPFYLACEKAKDLGFKIIYTGDGADELLLGYQALKKESQLKALVTLVRIVPRSIRKRILMLVGSIKDNNYISKKSIISRILAASLAQGNEYKRVIVSPNYFMFALQDFNLSRIFYIKGLESYFQTFILPQIYLQKTDRISAGLGLESRCPWLSNAFIDESMKMKRKNLLTQGKPIKLLLPKEDKKLIRGKHGLGVPLHKVLGLLDEPNWSIPEVDKKLLSDIWCKAQKGGAALQQLAWSFFVLQTKLDTWRKLSILR